MANWTTATPTRDQCISDCQTYGEWRQSIQLSPAAGTADNGLATGAGITMSRCTNPVTVPAVTSPTTGYVITQMDIYQSPNAGAFFGGLEYNFGNLTVSGNSYSHVGALPTKTIYGTSQQLGAHFAFAVVTTALTATTPVITFTYTNESGTTSRSGTITLPTNAAAGSAFLLNRHLQAGDTGIQDITGVSISTGSAGSVAMYGFMLMSCGSQGSITGTTSGYVEPLNVSLPLMKVVPGEIIAFYSGTIGANVGYAYIIASPEQ